MLHFHPQSNQSSEKDSDRSLPTDLIEVINNLLSESKLTQTQIQRIQRYLSDDALQISNRTFKFSQSFSSNAFTRCLGYNYAREVDSDCNRF